MIDYPNPEVLTFDFCSIKSLGDLRVPDLDGQCTHVVYDA